MDTTISLLLAILSIIAFIIGPIVFFLWFHSWRKKKYRDFVYKHSVGFTELIKLNELYTFKDIKKFDMVHDYDNESYYHDISPKDYLTYQLLFIYKDVLQSIKDAESNKGLYGNYWFSVKGRCIKNSYDVEKIPKNKRLLAKVEERLLEEYTQKPTMELKIRVALQLRNINGEFKKKKIQIFDEGEIRLLITKITDKNGTYYNDRETWESICRVERGKVSSRMRFAIYERDEYKCVKCGSKKNLEIDHIIPVSKGGKSSFENLQTLCHHCNVLKGMEIEVNHEQEGIQ